MPDSIGALIARHAAHQPNRPAIVGTTFTEFSYRDLDLWIKEIGVQLRAAGIAPHSRVAIMLPRGPEAAMIALAVASHAISVSLDINRPDIEIEHELARVRPDALVLPNWVDLPVLAIARRASFGLMEAARATGSLATIGLREIREASQSRNSGVHCNSVIFSTSGTTGSPKLVPVTLDNLLAMADKMQRLWFNLSPEDRTAFVLPGYYRAATTISFLAPLLLGGSVVLPTTQQTEDLAQWVPQTCPTWLWGNPTFFKAVLDRLRGQTGLTHSLRFVVSGTAYLPPTLRTEIEVRLGCPVLQSYGMSETGILAADPAPPAKRKPDTTGLVSRDELVIVGSKGELLPDGEVGEIVVHGPSVSPDIDPDVERQRPRDRGLFTGDLGFLDPDGYLTVVGRAKEMINRGGEKISPHAIENALLLHPAIQEAAAFAVPHPRLGENVAAAVTLKPNADTNPQDIKTFLTTHLAPFKIPQNIWVVRELPKGPTGKVSRPQLSASFLHRVRDVISPRTPLEFQIISIWQNLLGRDDFGVEDDFFELGGDSLLAATMMLEVETIARRKIPFSVLTGIWTIRQLAVRIIDTSDTPEELVTRVRQGGGTPLFFCHGDFRTRGLWALKLFEKLAVDSPVFLVKTDPNPEANLSIQEMARFRLPHLLAAHPVGSFRIGGFCNGGLLAWELAHQLECLGRQVELVVLVDTVSLNTRPTIRAMVRLIRLIATVLPTRVRDTFKLDSMSTLWNNLRRAPFYGPYLRAMSNYLPPHLKSNVAIVVCEKSRVKRSFSTKAWGRLAPRVQTQYTPGSHVGCITTHANELAGLFDRLLSVENTQGSESKADETPARFAPISTVDT